MQKYLFLYENKENDQKESNHAGSKAPSDIITIAEKIGFKPIYIKKDSKSKGFINRIKRAIRSYKCWAKSVKNMQTNSVVLIQYPIYQNDVFRNYFLHKIKNKKHIRIISLVHDVEQIRNNNIKEYYDNEFETMLRLSDIIIVHNNNMLQWFKNQGVNEEKLVNIQIFDYLQTTYNAARPKFKQSITIAGNLDVKKATYIEELSKLHNVDINLYGPNYSGYTTKIENIHYHGSFPPNEIPNKLTEGFGLVWDGTSIETCAGLTGQYLKYNNPHKLSLFLSSGLPVVIWSHAAEADFVKKNGVGICVDSLYNLESVLSRIQESDYYELADHAAAIGQNLRAGAYTTRALEEACKKLI